MSLCRDNSEASHWGLRLLTGLSASGPSAATSRALLLIRSARACNERPQPRPGPGGSAEPLKLHTETYRGEGVLVAAVVAASSGRRGGEGSYS